ncbi:hypothetical protein BJY00DRAFT_289145, partial [Aspergillus carlsbadensis]
FFFLEFWRVPLNRLCSIGPGVGSIFFHGTTRSSLSHPGPFVSCPCAYICLFLFCIYRYLDRFKYRCLLTTVKSPQRYLSISGVVEQSIERNGVPEDKTALFSSYPGDECL